jgi:hypothetical protein
MRKQKQRYIPQVLTEDAVVEITAWDAGDDFTTSPIQFPESIDWSLAINGWDDVTPGNPTVTILHSNTVDGDYVPYSTSATDIDITVDKDRMIYDEHFAARYMKIQYVSGGSTGVFSMILSK